MAVCNYLMRANLSVAIVCMNTDSFALDPDSNHTFRNATVGDGFFNGTDGDIKHEVKVGLLTLVDVSLTLNV